MVPIFLVGTTWPKQFCTILTLSQTMTANHRSQFINCHSCGVVYGAIHGIWDGDSSNEEEEQSHSGGSTLDQNQEGMVSGGGMNEEEEEGGEEEEGEDEEESKEEEDPICVVCGGTPCEWKEYGADVIQEVEVKFNHQDGGLVVDVDTGDLVPLETLRHLCYAAFTKAKYGVLGKKNRILPPQCILDEI